MERISIRRNMDNDKIALKIFDGTRSLTATLNLEETKKLVELLQDAIKTDNYHNTLRTNYSTA